MPAALSISERRKIIEMREQGNSFKAIALELNRDYEAVRKIYHRYVQSGELAPSYAKCSHSTIRKDETIYRRALEMKRNHPSWGAGIIWVELAEEFDEVQLPTPRTLQRWFKRGGVQNPPQERRPRPFPARGKRAHEVWAMDAKEQIELADGSFVSWLTVTDEGSGAIVGAFLFPPQALVDNRPPAGESGAPRPNDILGSSRKDTNG